MNFGSWVKARLGAAGMTQAELAAELDVDAGLVSRAIREQDGALRDRIRARLKNVKVSEPETKKLEHNP